MNRMNDKLLSIQAQIGSDWALYISPDIEKLPIEIARFDDPYLPYMRAIHRATNDLVCAYVLDFGAYLRLGAAGAIALERSIDFIGGSHLVILDAAIASVRYTGLWDDTAYGCDALTIADSRVLDAYQNRDDRIAFMMAEGDVDERSTPTYWYQAQMFGLGTARIRVLPQDTLSKARHLDFEGKLRETVSAVTHE